MNTQITNLRRDLERAKLLMRNRAGSYDAVNAAAKKLAAAINEHQRLRYPGMRLRPISVQGLIRNSHLGAR